MSLRITALLPILASLGLSCQLEGRPGDKPSAAAAEAQAEAADGKPTLQLGRSRQAAIPLGIWPATTSMMMGLDVAAINKSPLGYPFNAMIRGGNNGFLPTTTSCQQGLVDSIDTMLFIQGPTGASNKSVVAIRGMKRSEVQACVAAESTSAAQKFGANYGALGDNLEKHLIWWHDAETFLFSSEGGKREIDLARPDKLRAPTNAALLKSIARIDTSAAVWIAAVGTPVGMSESVEEFRASIDLKDRLNASVRVQYDNPDSATAAVKEVKTVLKSLPPFSKYLEESRVRAEGDLLQFDLSMTRSQVAEFANDPMLKGVFQQQ